jgi:arylsulfatase A-like enzyme
MRQKTPRAQIAPVTAGVIAVIALTTSMTWAERKPAPPRLDLTKEGAANLVLAVPAAAEGRRPNVVMIMADDLGYNDLGCYDHPKIKTPVLDGLAKEGIRLTSFYSGATVCTPSRMALLTGAYAWRTGWTQGVVGFRMPKGEGMSPEALTIAEVFQSAGYATAISGKWHVGDNEASRPHRQGFESTYYIARSNNQTTELYRADEVVEKPFKNALLTEQFTKDAIRFIEEKGGKPFFLYVPYTAPHFPVQAHPKWKGSSDFGEYGDVVEEMDFRIGEIVEALRARKVYQDTIVIFMSDNGPETRQAARSTPYRGLKWSALEGANRVPCIIRWEGKIPAGQVSDALVGAIDLLPTLCRASGIDLKTASTGSPVIDGVDVWPTLTGKKDGPSRDEQMFWHGMGRFDAIRSGDWKLFVNREGAAIQNKEDSDEMNAKVRALGRGKAPALFNLAEEPEELTDLSAKHPERVKEMQALAGKRLSEIRSKVIPLVK